MTTLLILFWKHTNISSKQLRLSSEVLNIARQTSVLFNQVKYFNFSRSSSYVFVIPILLNFKLLYKLSLLFVVVFFLILFILFL